ncbi:hypothetical protein [Salinibacter sp.]|uniref:hypothetical protein n=1 Tax=Salinibacter sp. TaxID=2065818 RepID=UPI0021E7C98D|nr:hypothetical protein [Salinibacter sp.]
MESILDLIDFSKTSKRARKESRSRETHLPPVSTYRWWARRTSAVSDAVVEAAVQKEGIDALCDPFAGGGTFTLSALLKDVSAYGQDVNPWAASGLATMLDLPSSEVLKESARKLEEAASDQIENAYQTEFRNGDEAEIAHTLRVAVTTCPECGEKIRLFPYAVVSLLNRKDSGGKEGWLACSSGHLFCGSINESSECEECGERVEPDAQYTEGRIAECPCGYEAKISDLFESSDLDWEPVLVERAVRGRREIDTPTEEECKTASDREWDYDLDLGTIPQTTETRVLRRHGYETWEDCYPDRQLHLLDTLLKCCDEVATSKKDRKALRIAVIGSAEMAGHLSRWDRWYLKSYEAMANHRYNFTTLSCEPNVWGASVGRGTVRRRLTQIRKASEWFDNNVSSKITVEEISKQNREKQESLPNDLSARVVVGSSEQIALPDNEVPLVFTDPPYHDDVRYGDLSALFRAWTDTAIDLRKEAVARRNGGISYSEKLKTIFRECKRVLEPEGHMVISFANRNPEAWIDLFESFIDADFRACGFGIVHSENETDHSKRGVNACTLDLVLDLVGSDEKVDDFWDGSIEADTDQEWYLNRVGMSFLKYVQPAPPDGWREKFAQETSASDFTTG